MRLVAFSTFSLFFRYYLSPGTLQDTFQASSISHARAVAHNDDGNMGHDDDPAYREGPTAAHRASQDHCARVQNAHLPPLPPARPPSSPKGWFHSRPPT